MTCPTCHGSGRTDRIYRGEQADERQTCARCLGAGKIPECFACRCEGGTTPCGWPEHHAAMNTMTVEDRRTRR